MSSVSTKTPNIEYETTTFSLKPDKFGANKATLLHARTEQKNSAFYKAVLYIHGYSDYYFHDHVCWEFLKNGYDFFALDLRKCGRSIISPEQDQYRHYFSDICEYDEEITLSIEHILQQAKTKPKKLFLLGHSTGGLIVSLYASSGAKYKDIDGLILNSPFISPIETNLTEYLLSNALMKFGGSVDIDDSGYNKTIHTSQKGEWDFDPAKKSVNKIRVHGSSFYAIDQAQKDLISRGSSIKCPILLMCSSRSIKPDKIWRDDYFQADLILNVTTMRRVASTMGPQVTIYEVEHGMHDIFLSQLSVRTKAFYLMFVWLKREEDTWDISTTD